MDELISRQAAIDIVRHECSEWKGLAKEIVKQLNGLTAEPSHDGFLEFLFNIINPNEMEQYMAMYNHKTGVKEAGND